MTNAASSRSRIDLIREALRILDGQEPEQLELSGDGWCLVPDEPEPRSRDERPFLTLLGEALDEAVADGWALAPEPVEPEASSVDEGWSVEGQRSVVFG